MIFGMYVFDPYELWSGQLIFFLKLLQDIKERKDEDLLVLPTDAAIFDDPSFRVYYF